MQALRQRSGSFLLAVLLSTVLALAPTLAFPGGARADGGVPAGITIEPQVTTVAARPDLSVPITGIVTDAQGQPVAGVTVTLTSSNTSTGTVQPTAVTDADGGYAAALAVGTMVGSTELCASAGPTVYACATVSTVLVGFPSQATLTLSATQVAVGDSVQVSGSVLDANGTGVPHASVSLAVADVGGMVSPASVTTQLDGSFTATYTAGTPAGSGAIQVQVDWGTLGSTPVTVVQPDHVPAQVTIVPLATRLGTSGIASPLTGRVTDAQNAPVPNTLVRFTNSNPMVIVLAGPFAVTDGNGTYTTSMNTTLMMGSATLCATVGSDLSSCVQVETVPVGPPAKATLTVSTQTVRPGDTVTVQGQLTDAFGTGTPEVFVDLRPQGITGTVAPSYSRTQADGRFTATFTAAEPTGRGSLMVPSFWGTTLGQVDLLVVGDPAAIDLALPPAVSAGEQTTLTGTVRDAYGTPVPNTPVELRASVGTLPAQVVTDAAGAFTATLTAPTQAGNVTVTAAVAGTAIVAETPLAVLAGPVQTLALAAADKKLISGATTTVTGRAVDQYGNPVSGLPVTLQVERGTFSDSAPITSSDGTFQVTFTAPAKPGALRLTAVAGGVQAQIVKLVVTGPRDHD